MKHADGDPFVLDTSAVLALIESEGGADRVEHLLRHEQPLIPFVVMLEVYYLSLQSRGQAVADERHSMLKSMPAVSLNEMDEATLLAAAKIKAAHPLSLADAMIAGFALRHGGILVHKDPEYEVLRHQIRLEALPYKSRRHR